MNQSDRVKTVKWINLNSLKQHSEKSFLITFW